MRTAIAAYALRVEEFSRTTSARVYPNGHTDVHHFHAAGGTKPLKGKDGPLPELRFDSTGGIS